MTDKEILKLKGHLTYSDSYLQSMNKEWLIQYIRCLEHNWAGAEQCCDNQYKLLSQMQNFEWIKCSDKLPPLIENEECSKDVLVIDGCFMGVACLIDVNFCCGAPEYEWWNGHGRCYDVTHWMPLPEPPKAEVIT